MNEVISKIKLLKTKNKYDIFEVNHFKDRTTLTQDDARGQVMINLVTPYVECVGKGYRFFNKDVDSIFAKEDNTLALRVGQMDICQPSDPLPKASGNHDTIYIHVIKDIIKATENILDMKEENNCLQYLAFRGEYCYACDGSMLVRLPNPLPLINDFLVDVSRLKQYVKILSAMKIKQMRVWQEKDRLIFESVNTVYTTPKFEDVYLILKKSNLVYPNVEKLIRSGLCASAKIESSEIHHNINDMKKANIPKYEILAFTQSYNKITIKNTNCQNNPKSGRTPHDISSIESDTCFALEIFHNRDDSFDTFYINNLFYSRLKNIFPKNHVIRMDWGDGALSPKYFYNDSNLVLIMPSQFKG